MNNRDLEQLLAAVRLPPRTEEYWEQFPKRIASKLHWESQRRSSAAAIPLRKLKFALSLAGVVGAVACLAITFALGLWRGQKPANSGSHLALVQECFEEVEAFFPNQVGAIIFDRQGPHLILTEQPDVPASPPVYLKIRGPRAMQEVVTFSGQQIRLDGEICDVLINGAGEVLLVGRQMAWSSARPKLLAGRYQVEARTLKASP